MSRRWLPDRLLRYESARSRVVLAEENIKLADDELEIARDRFQNLLSDLPGLIEAIPFDCFREEISN
jgi:hypothetical protein